MEVTGEINTFPNTVPHKVLTCSTDLNRDTISGTTHMKTLFSFAPGTGKHFTGYAL